MSHPTFTVFTPTYNRKHTLPRVYDSLRNQTFQDFEWLIIDDGSTDGTGDLVRQWLDEATFPIRYIWQEHAGKAPATNLGVREAQGELFMTFDSDDSCVHEALERFNYHWQQIQAMGPEIAATYSAVTALCRDQYGNLVGDHFPEDVFDSNSVEIRYRYKVTGEKWGFQKTSILREFPFATAPDGTMVLLSVVWNAIAMSYRTRFVNEVLRIYWVGADDQLSTRNRVPGQSMLGHVIAWQTDLNTTFQYFRYSPKRFLLLTAHYCHCSFLSGISPWQQVRQLEGIGPRLLWSVAVIPTWVYTAIERFRARHAPA
jgi:glycosyltransferase involved in cell wall biosynthesis